MSGRKQKSIQQMLLSPFQLNVQEEAETFLAVNKDEADTQTLTGICNRMAKANRLARTVALVMFASALYMGGKDLVEGKTEGLVTTAAFAAIGAGLARRDHRRSVFWQFVADTTQKYGADTGYAFLRSAKRGDGPAPG
jgi:hypothetical protein